MKVAIVLKITQTIHRRDENWDVTVSGTVLAMTEQSTGSWFAHGKHTNFGQTHSAQKPDGDHLAGHR
jgi:hypothetical protein